MSRFLLTIGSFAVIVGLYVLYERLAVPMMLPERKSNRIFEEHADSGRNEELEPYFSLFPADSWERDPKASVQKLETDQAIILFQDDEVDGNFITLKPCTILFLDKDENLSEEERIRQAFVMRTPQYAKIEFDGPVDFSRIPFPSIKGGTLFGKVSIHSDMKEPGQQDDFHLDTENVVFAESPALTTISTLRDVIFRWGANSGEGSVLRIELARSDPKNARSPKAFSQLKFDSLRRLTMLFSETDGPVAAAPLKTSDTAPKTGAKVPPLPNQSPLPPLGAANTATFPLGTAAKLDVNCQREFVFVPGEKRGEWAARFIGNVLAVRTNPDGSTDQITGEELQVLFSPKTQNAKAKTATKSDNLTGLGSLEPTQFMVRGKMGLGNQPPVPAKLTSQQSGGVTMIGDQIRYDLLKDELVLETEKIAGASKDVSLFIQNNRYVFRSTKGFFYKMNPNGGAGTLTSSSPGNLQGTLGEGDQLKKVSATWNAIQMEPYQFDSKQVLVKMEGGVMFDMQGFGKMTADTFHLLCFVSEGTPGKTSDSALLGGVGAFTPDRAAILGKVHFENENGTCDVRQMDIVFETVAPEGKVQRSRWTSQLFCETPPRFTPRHAGFVVNPVVSSGRVLTAADSSPRNPPKPAILQVQHREQRAVGAPPQPRPTTVQPAIANQGPLPPVSPVTSSASSASSATPSAAPSNSGGFLGLRSGASRSAYAITGDRMKMLVQSKAGHSEPSVIQLDGNVRIVEKLTGSVTGEAIEILGEEVGVWNPSAPDTKIQIKGRSPKEAVFQGKGVTLRAMEINISRAENLIWSDGAGRLLAIVPAQSSMQAEQMPMAPLGAAKPGDDNRLLVDWNEQMSFDGKTLVFQGKPDQSGIRVRAIYQNTRIFADVMRIYLNRLVSFFDDQSDVPAKAEFIECARNVYVQTEEIENNRTRSVSTGLFAGMGVYVETGDFVADGPGEIQRTFVNDGKGFSVPGTSRPQGSQGELAHLYVRFHKNLRGNYLTNIVEINGKVLCMYCPVNSWDTKLGIEDQNSVAKRGYLMDCEKLEIVQMPNPNGETQNVELTASGRATIEGVNNLFAAAETIKYSQAKGLVVFDGNNFGKAVVHLGKKETTASKLEYNMETGSVHVLGNEGIEINR